MPARHDASEVPALIALFAGALAIGSSGIFVRLSETGPTATAFWRGAFALPLLAVWAALEARARAAAPPPAGRPPAAPPPAATPTERSWRDPMFFWAGVFFAGDLALWHASLLLLPLALTQKFLPATPHGWLLLAGCALSAQVLGQGLVAYALAHLPATFSSVGLYLQSIAATAYAWLLLQERLTPWQIAGGCIVLGAIALARSARRAPLPDLEALPAPQMQRASLQSSAPRHSESR